MGREAQALEGGPGGASPIPRGGQQEFGDGGGSQGDRDVGKARERWREQRKDKQNRKEREP